MVLDEFLPLLAEQGLDTSRVAFLGWSMGGYGAMLLGARLGAGRTAGICAVSPALWTSSGAAAPGAFDGAEDYAANSVWGLGALNGIPLRIDCGDDDPFASATTAIHRPAADAAGRWLLPRRAQRVVLVVAADLRAELAGPAADRLRARSVPSAAAWPMSVRKWLPGNLIESIVA